MKDEEILSPIPFRGENRNQRERRMNKEELEKIRAMWRQPLEVDAGLFDGPERTLLLGYTLHRNNWHVYLEAGEIHVLVYDAVESRVISHEARWAWPPRDLVPKRVFPERTCASFARLLASSGIEIPFTKFNEVWEVKQSNAFHAPRHSELRGF